MGGAGAAAANGLVQLLAVAGAVGTGVLDAMNDAKANERIPTGDDGNLKTEM